MASGDRVAHRLDTGPVVGDAIQRLVAIYAEWAARGWREVPDEVEVGGTPPPDPVSHPPATER